MPAIRKEYQCPGRGSYRAGSPCGSGGMGGTVVADVLQKDGAHGAPYGKTTACACSRVRRAHHATTAKHLQPISLPAAYILGACPRPYRGGAENHSLKTIETTNIMVAE